MRPEQWLYTIPLRLRSLFRRQQIERELDEELEYHIERQVEQNIARGMSARDARLEARRALGGVERRKNECRDFWGTALADHLARDTKQALRTLSRDVGFTTGVVMLLALGIGANVAVYSIVESILLNPLPYRDSDRLFIVRERIPERDETTRAVNPRHFVEWRRECGCFDDVALAEYVQDVTVTGEGDPERIPAVRVTPNAFSVLGVSAALGRTFVPEDAEPGSPDVVVISHSLWQRRFGGDPDVVGKTIALDGRETPIVGVLPRGFRRHWGARPNARIDIYAPWALTPPPPWWGWNNNYSFSALARLPDGLSAEAALAELDGIQAAIAADRFEGNQTLRARLIPLREWVTGQSREGLYLLLAAVGAALLVACLNIANLMLVRAVTRSREAGVRAALGASRIGIFRAVLIEAGLLSLAGVIAGVALAAGFLRFFVAVAPADLPRLDEVGMDWTALAAALGLAVTATVAFGLLPALRMTRVDPQQALHTNSRSFTDSSGRLRLRQALVSAEVGLSAALLIVAGLLLMSFVRLGAVERGFDASNVLTASISLPYARYGSDDEKLRFYDALLEDLRSAPGVMAAGLTSALPLRGNNWGSYAVPEGQRPQPGEEPPVEYRFVSTGYLEAMGIPLLTGRSFTREDQGRSVAVFSRSAARLLWPGGDAVGRRFWRGDPDDTFEVVGLVPDVPSADLATAPAPLVYQPLTGTGGVVFPFASVAIRTAGDPALAAGVLRAVVRSLDSALAVSDVRTMQQIESASLGERRFQLTLVAAFGAAALVIAALGTYGVLAYTVASRTQELAIRLALGAHEFAVRSLVMRHGMRPVLVGLALGIAFAFVLGRLISSLLFSVTPSDPTTLSSVAAVTLGAAFLASWIPARRAARTSPVAALRYE